MHPIDRRRARLSAALSLVLAFYTAQGSVTLPWILPAHAARLVADAMYFITAAYLCAYFLIRGCRLAGGIYVMIAAQLATPTFLAVLLGAGPNIDPLSHAAWMGFGVLTAAGLLSNVAVLFVGGVALLVQVGTCVELGFAGTRIGESATWLIGLTAIAFVCARHRDAVEQIRQTELREKNLALEELLGSLEAQVSERTRALELSRRELEEAYAELQKNQSALLQTEKMAAIGRLTAGFAHELASPISAVRASINELELLRQELVQSIGDPSVTPDDLREIAAELKDALDLAATGSLRAATFVRGIRSHTRTHSANRAEEFDVRNVVEEASQLVMHAHARRAPSFASKHPSGKSCWSVSPAD